MFSKLDYTKRAKKEQLSLLSLIIARKVREKRFNQFLADGIKLASRRPSMMVINGGRG